RLTARYADLWNGAWPSQAALIEPLLDAVDAACAEVGRDPTSLGRTAGVMVDLPGNYPHRGHDWVTKLRARRPPLSGTLDEIAAEFRRFVALGVEHIQVWLDPVTAAGIEEFGAVLELLDAPA